MQGVVCGFRPFDDGSTLLNGLDIGIPIVVLLEEAGSFIRCQHYSSKVCHRDYTGCILALHLI